MSYDLDIENYSLDDLLALFGVTAELDADQLRRIKRTAAMMHPDKSGLAKDVFIFFREAASILVEVAAATPCPRSTTYANDMDIEDSFYEHIGRSGSFTSRFNTLFEEYKALKGDKCTGYGEWLKGPSSKPQTGLKSTGELHREFENERQRLGQLVERKQVSAYDGGAGEPISEEKGSNDAAPFSQLGYRDLRAAYEESITPAAEVLERSYETVLSERSSLPDASYKTSYPDTSFSDKARRFALSREQVRVQRAMSELASKLLSQ